MTSFQTGDNGNPFTSAVSTRQNCIYADMSDGPSSQSNADFPSIDISFGGPSSALWDDGELVRSYDAAMSEFHVSV